jgi:hypothetical protein
MSGNDYTCADGQGNEYHCRWMPLWWTCVNDEFHQVEQGQNQGSIKPSAPSGVNISCVSYHDTFLQGMKFALCVWLEDNDGDCHDTIKLVYEDMR